MKHWLAVVSLFLSACPDRPRVVISYHGEEVGNCVEQHLRFRADCVYPGHDVEAWIDLAERPITPEEGVETTDADGVTYPRYPTPWAVSEDGSDDSIQGLIVYPDGMSGAYAVVARCFTPTGDGVDDDRNFPVVASERLAFWVRAVYPTPCRDEE